MNTFDCVPTNLRPETVQTEADNSFSEKTKNRQTETNSAGKLTLFPNPSSGFLLADLSPWKGQAVKISMLDGQGNLLQALSVEGGDESFSLDLANDLPNGIYFVEIIPSSGERQVQRVALQR